MIRSLDADTDFFDIVAGVLQGDTLAPYLSIDLPRLRTMNVNKSKKRKKIHIKNVKKHLITLKNWHLDYTDDLALLANTPIKAESHLHILEKESRDIRLFVNTIKTKFTRLKQEGAISTLRGKPLKLGNKFTYYGSIIPSCP